MSTAVLEKLVELTAPPPVGDADALIVAFEEMYLARQAVLATLTGKVADTEHNRALLCELAARDAAWERALTAARDAVGAARSNTHKLRSYAR